MQELLKTIQSAAGEALAVDRRPKLNDRLLAPHCEDEYD